MTRSARIEIEVDGDATGAVRAADRTSRAYKDLGRDLDGVDRRSRTTSSGLGGLAGGLSRIAGPAAVAGAGLGIAAGAAFSLAQSASDAGEAASAAQAVFGSAYGQIEKAAQGASQTIGLSRTAYLDSAKTFGVLGQAAGLTGKDLAGFSQEMITAAGDMASFNNTSVDDAIAAIGSGLRGEAEPLRRFGILLDDATLRTKALELGLIKTTKDALTPQQKTLAAQAVVMGQLGAAQGDNAKTSGELAGQQRRLKAESENLRAELGQNLLPVTNTLVKGLNENVVPALRTAAGAFAEGGSASTLAGGALDVFKGKTEGASGAQLALGLGVKTATAPTRTLANFISGAATPIMAAWRSGVDRVRDALGKHPRTLDAVRGALAQVSRGMDGAGKVAGVLGKAAGATLGAAFGVMSRAISGAIGIVDNLIGAWQRARDVVAGAVGAIRSAIANLPGGGLLDRILGTGGPTLALASGAGPAGRSPALATAAVGSWSSGSASTWGSSPMVLAPATTINIRIEGFIGDELKLARQIETVLGRYGELNGTRRR